MTNSPGHDCHICPRLSDFRRVNRGLYPGFHNNPVPSFGGMESAILIVGLAPGLKGANATGRPFTGDWAGELLYQSLLVYGLAKGNYARNRNDGLILENCRITNAVRCVPPGNRPTVSERKGCGTFLAGEIHSMSQLRTILAIGGFAHDAILSVYGLKKSRFPFSHGKQHNLPEGITLVDSYHCSRLNTNTGRLTAEMFQSVIRQCLDTIR